MTKRSSQRVVIDVRCERGWWVRRIGSQELTHVATHPLKSDAVSAATALAKHLTHFGARTQVRIFKKNGQIQRESTFPRSSDPTRSKG